MKINGFARWVTLFNIGLLAIVYGCDDKDEPLYVDTIEISDTFDEGPDGWSGDYADYYVGDDELMELGFEHASLPDPLDSEEQTLKLVGTNRSDDLFMYLKKKVDGLQPSTRYALTFSVTFVSNVEDDLVGIGGSPGESVFIKVGASKVEPEKMVVTEGQRDYYRMNIDKGNQANGGEDAIVIVDFSNDTDASVYTLKTLGHEAPVDGMTNAAGELWLLVGTDSGFEGTTEIYYNRISTIIEPIDDTLEP